MSMAMRDMRDFMNRNATMHYGKKKNSIHGSGGTRTADFEKAED